MATPFFTIIKYSFYRGTLPRTVIHTEHGGHLGFRKYAAAMFFPAECLLIMALEKHYIFINTLVARASRVLHGIR